MNIRIRCLIEWVGHGRVNENHLTFASKGDMKAMNHKKHPHVNQDRYLNSSDVMN